MGRRKKFSDKSEKRREEDYFGEMYKGRKRPWKPKEKSLSLNKTSSTKKDPYKRTKFDWRKLLNDEELDV